MSIEAFIWGFDHGEHSTFPLEDVLNVFRPFTESFDPATGVLQACFGEPIVDACDIYLGGDSAEKGFTSGLMISRPVRHLRLWDCVLAIMHSGNVMLLFTDDSTPYYANAGAFSHFPQDLIESLGVPKLITSAKDIIAAHEQ